VITFQTATVVSLEQEFQCFCQKFIDIVGEAKIQQLPEQLLRQWFKEFQEEGYDLSEFEEWFEQQAWDL
jgi:DNA polymerase IIIc chi subunit